MSFVRFLEFVFVHLAFLNYFIVVVLVVSSFLFLVFVVGAVSFTVFLDLGSLESPCGCCGGALVFAMVVSVCKFVL